MGQDDIANGLRDIIAESNKIIHLAKALNRLQNNQDFQLVIKEGYFKDKAVQTVMLKCHPEMQTEKLQKLLDQQIIAISSLNNYFEEVVRIAEMAEKTLSEAEEAYHNNNQTQFDCEE